MIKKKQGKTHLYIDGTNLFAGLYDLFGAKILPFSEVLKEISKLVRFDEVYFYASYIGKVNLKNKKLRSLVEAESEFFDQVKNTDGLYFYKGHRSPASGKEKGVDVHLAVDIVKHAFRKKSKRAVIMTGDADLVYPLEIARELGCSTHAVFLPNRFSLGIAFMADTATVLNYLDKFEYKGEKKKLRKLNVVKIKRPHI